MFNASERAGLLLLIPMAAVVAAMLFFARRPRPVDMPVAACDSLVRDTLETVAAADSAELFFFDPNTADLRTFMRLGISRRCAASIIKYRNAGKVFAVREDFASCYCLGDEEYFRLEPYIRIGEEYAARPAVKQGRVAACRDTACSVKTEDTIPPKVYDHREPDAGTAALVDINRADSAALRSVRGVGAYTVGRIMEYRGRLGGFVRDSQLLEAGGVRPENFELIRTQIFIDTCAIQKIDVNFAAPKRINDALAAHPYGGALVVRRLLKVRQLKGGWRTIEDMVHDEILTQQQAERLAPYLMFDCGR